MTREFHTIGAQLCQIAVASANERGLRICVVVLDDRFGVSAVVRMDGTPVSTFKFAHAKAWTALNFSRPTRVLAPQGPTPMALNLAAVESNLLYVGGGELLAINGEIAGAVGVSGASEAEDVDLASVVGDSFAREPRTPSMFEK